MDPSSHDGSILAEAARRYLEALLRADRGAANRLILELVDRGTPIRDVYMHIFQPVQYEIGDLWERNKITIAQEHYCTAVTQFVMAQLYPRIFSGERNGLSAVTTAVGGDLHELGVRMVSDFLEMEGWDTYYLGANTPTDAVLAALGQQRPTILAVSATLRGHVAPIARLIEAVRSDPSFAAMPILVGGQPFNDDPTLWRSIGADGSARDATGATRLARELAVKSGA